MFNEKWKKEKKRKKAVGGISCYFIENIGCGTVLRSQQDLMPWQGAFNYNKLVLILTSLLGVRKREWYHKIGLSFCFTQMVQTSKIWK